MRPFDTAKPESPHHYVFAHVALRQACFANPVRFFALMASPYRQEFLDSLWQQICTVCDQHGKAQFLPKDVNIQMGRIGEYPAIVVQMPTPCHVPEAHMVCIVLKVPIDELKSKSEIPDAQVRYFTLEKGVDISGRDRTVLCAWDGEKHINFGDGPEATVMAFLDAIKELI